jgi:hypothetical protein
MRIGTWNLAGRWTDDHRIAMVDQDCDLWLLTEVSERLAMDGYHLHRGAGVMAKKRRWAAVLSRTPLLPLADPHPASTMAQVEGITVCSSILPWKGSGGASPWIGTRHADRTLAAVRDLDKALPRTGLVWGGDWNHALSGREYAGGVGGRTHILDLLSRRGIDVPTARLPHRIEGLLSIDHIGLTSDLTSGGANRFRAVSRDGRQLSDHDGYVVNLL